MKNILKSTLYALCLAVVASCAGEKVTYDFSENPGPAATFSAEKLQIPGLTAEDNGKLYIPLYRGNVKGTAKVGVALSGGEEVCELATPFVEFADGENVANIEITFDFETLTPKPATLKLEIAEEKDLAYDGIQSTTFTFVKQLTYETVGTGAYYSYFWHAYFGDPTAGMWDQELLKAKEGNYFKLKDCWSVGTDFSFFCDGETVDWYTDNTGTSYGSYGNIYLNFTGGEVYKNDDGLYELALSVPAYYLPAMSNYVLVPDGVEVFTVPAGFEFNK